MAWNRADHRKCERLKAQLHATVRVIRADESQSPLVLDAMVNDLCEGGMQIALFRISERDYRDLVQKPHLRPIRVDCTFPTDRRTARLVGIIAHAEHLGRDSNPNCALGIRFEDLDTESLQALNVFITAARARTHRLLCR